MTGSTNVRPRVDADLDACVDVLAAVHRTGGYPAYWPEDPPPWLSPGELLGAWVAERHGRIVGHVALQAATGEAGAAVWSEATALPPERLAAITRLFVAPESRGAGVGSLLVDVACAEAAARGLHPVLEVAETEGDAIRLYERRGWRRVASAPWAEGAEMLLHRYVAPSG